MSAGMALQALASLIVTCAPLVAPVLISIQS